MALSRLVQDGVISKEREFPFVLLGQGRWEIAKICIVSSVLDGRVDPVQDNSAFFVLIPLLFVFFCILDLDESGIFDVLHFFRGGDEKNEARRSTTRGIEPHSRERQSRILPLYYVAF